MSQIDVDEGLWRDLWAYWILGLCNNNGFVVMLCAAHDILQMLSPNHEYKEVQEGEIERACNIYSTGLILLANIVPTLCLKLIMAYLPLWINVHILLAASLSFASFLVVSLATVDWLAILGVALTSASCGIREAALLAYSSHFDPNVVSTWSSGNSVAGVIGSLSYALMRSFGLSFRTSILLMLLYPIVEIPVFWILLRVPRVLSSDAKRIRFTDEQPLPTIWQKVKFIPQISAYLLPLSLVYFFEYFIIMGLFELVLFEKAYIDRDAQFRWFNFDFQMGVFMLRLTIDIFKIKKIWILSILQGINVVYFLTEAIWLHTPSIVIFICMVFWEGCLGGAAYINAFYRMSKEIPPHRRQLSFFAITVANTFAVVIAGILCLPVHREICKMPGPTRSLWAT